MSEPRSERRFPTTHWSIVERLRSADDQIAQRALEEVFSTYRYPLYSYLRATGQHHEDAEDLLQGFFQKMLRLDSLGRADVERGKLRTFLLTALNRFRLNWQRGEVRRHRRVQLESDLWTEEEARYQWDRHATQENPELFYERRWAAGLIARVRERLREHYTKRQRAPLHDALSPLLTSDEAEDQGSFAEIAERLGLKENALRVSLHRLRKDFRQLLLDEVRRTLAEGQDVREELRYLLGVFEK
jgi:RNA polymerase sigma-70 factor (ECF subfamily)